MRTPVAAALTLVALLWGTAFAALPDFTRLVERAAPSVVNISATRPMSNRRLGNLGEQPAPEFFRRFFREMPRGTPSPGVGSGFIISQDGYILTNNHVVEGAEEIVVALSDRRERVATLIGADSLSDLALLKIDEDNLPAVKLGRSETLKVGEWVLAIGSPFGFQHSVTKGIVSAKGRSLPEDANNYVPFIQTDVAINPGNSGGPLFNMDGEVVGINSQIFTRSGGFMGLSFAIPVDVAMEVVAQLKDTGHVRRGWLGVYIQQVDRDLAESFGLDRPSGALVTQIFPGGPAEKAGIREGDIIPEFNKKKIDLSTDLPQIVGRTPAESEVKVLVVRAGKRKIIDVAVGHLDESDLPGQRLSGIPSLGPLGVEVRDLGPDDEQQMAGATKGVMVTRVVPGAGQAAGMRVNDVITMLNGEWVADSATFEQLTSKLETGVPIPVRIVRGGGALFLALKLED